MCTNKKRNLANFLAQGEGDTGSRKFMACCFCCCSSFVNRKATVAASPEDGVEFIVNESEIPAAAAPRCLIPPSTAKSGHSHSCANQKRPSFNHSCFPLLHHDYMYIRPNIVACHHHYRISPVPFRDIV